MPIDNEWLKNKKYTRKKEPSEYEKIEKFVSDEEKEKLKTMYIKDNHFNNNIKSDTFEKELIEKYKYRKTKIFIKIFLTFLFALYLFYINK